MSEEMNISFGSFYKRASFWRNRKKMNKRGCGGVAPVEWQNLQKCGRIYKKCIRGRFALAGMEDFSYICHIFFNLRQ
jgi:hypothetical protein